MNEKQINLVEKSSKNKVVEYKLILLNFYLIMFENPVSYLKEKLKQNHSLYKIYKLKSL